VNPALSSRAQARDLIQSNYEDPSHSFGMTAKII
jgi:hypothetical protein